MGQSHHQNHLDVFLDFLNQESAKWDLRKFHNTSESMRWILDKDPDNLSLFLTNAGRARLGYFANVAGERLVFCQRWIEKASPYTGETPIAFFTNDPIHEGMNRSNELAVRFNLARGGDIKSMQRTLDGEIL